MTAPLVAALAACADLPEQLLAQHTDDATGRCRVCAVGGQHGRHLWPCRLHDLATAAIALRQQSARHAP